MLPPKTVTVAMSLWGANPRYTDSAVQLANVLPKAAERAGAKIELWVYHDDTVPKAVLAKLVKAGATLRQAPTKYPYTEERRATWRFLALAERCAVMFLDADIPVSRPFCMGISTILSMLWLDAQANNCVVRTFRPSWRHNGILCIPAGFTGICQPAPDKALPAHLEKALRKTPTVRTSSPIHQSRSPHGYGADEWYLTTGLRPRLARLHGAAPVYQAPSLYCGNRRGRVRKA